MIRPILFHPDPRLKKNAEAVNDISDALRALAADMLETMYKAPGIGLAAPQVGISTRLIVLDCEKDDSVDAKPLVMVNPEIVSSSEEMNVYEEGCLSIPDHFAEVTRPREVEVKWMDLNGAAQFKSFDGLWATCVQHEIDHLNGILFLDYLGAMRRQVITRKMQKFKKEQARKKAQRE